MHVRNNEINFFTYVEKISLNQDTTIVPSNQQQTEINTELILKQNQEKDTVILNQVPQIDFSSIDSILRKSEEREQQILLEQQQIVRPVYKRKFDTTEILYKQFGIAGFPLKEKLIKDPFSNNFLYNFSSLQPSEKTTKQNVFIESETAFDKNQYSSSLKKNVEIKPQYISGKVQFDWITILLIMSFLLLGWVRLFNKKYLVSLVKSVVSYQESYTLYREKNSLMERASFLINILFISSVSIFVIQIKYYFDLNFVFDDYKIYLILMGSLIGLYIFRLLTTSFIAYVFLKQKVFSEYFHNVNLFTKNTGLFLFPIVIILQFLSYQYVGFMIYVGLIFIGVLYLLLIFRAFQIIIRKNVSIFYMILYLCAFEFVPFLIIYKLILSI